ncbi:hypothetical protein [uncultured Kordia sp.]|uniref:hypothetical protein n=1 Tax=uncultured Kordia sp. TaxID=507699 RepID=UPI0026330617|nr:hypothetical protein [uncultured Kordia sp.]
MKKRNLKTLRLNKKNVSNLNQDTIIGGRAASSKSVSAATCCLSCTRSCNNCPLTIEDDKCKPKA